MREDDVIASQRAMGTMPVVVSTTVTVFALLVVIMILFVVRRNKSSIRRVRMRPSTQFAPYAPPPYAECEAEATPTAIVSENDRTALISFADGTQAALPSYDDVTRGRYPPRLRRLSAPVNRNNPASADVTAPQNSDDRAMTSQRADATSVTFGSIETMTFSDNTSTTVTLGTYDSGSSNPSLATSRALCGQSITSDVVATSATSAAGDDCKSPAFIQCWT